MYCLTQAQTTKYSFRNRNIISLFPMHHFSFSCSINWCFKITKTELKKQKNTHTTTETELSEPGLLCEADLKACI